MLEQMLRWQVGTQKNFGVSCGKLGNYLPKEQYVLYLATLPDGDISHFWTAMEKACILFRQTAEQTAKVFEFVFPEKAEKGSVSMRIWSKRK